jgi:hypothetical protein
VSWSREHGAGADPKPQLRRRVVADGHPLRLAAARPPRPRLRRHVEEPVAFTSRRELPSGEVIAIIGLGPELETTYPDRRSAGHRSFVAGLYDTPYGSREYSARDLEGNVWTFGTYHPVAGD